MRYIRFSLLAAACLLSLMALAGCSNSSEGGETAKGTTPPASSGGATEQSAGANSNQAVKAPFDPSK